MKLIRVGAHHFAKVSDEDYPLVAGVTWNKFENRSGNRRRVYARAADYTLMHRLILGLTDPAVKVDHRDGDSLNNQRDNLRIATPAQNGHNRRPHLGRRFKGAIAHYSGKFRSVITHNGTSIYLGTFPTEIAAAEAYDAKAKELFGEFAWLNFPTPACPRGPNPSDPT